MSRLITELITA